MIFDDDKTAIARAAGRAFVRRCERDGIQETVEKVGGHHWVQLLHCLALAAAPAPVLRAALEEAWLVSSLRLGKAGWHGPRLLRLFRRAQFDVSALPEEFTVWRGGRSTPSRPYSLAEAARGVSWSLRKETAAYYACAAWRVLNPAGVPMVVRRRVRRADVVYFRSDSRDLEVVVDGPVVGLEVDGGPLEWMPLSDVELMQRHEMGMALLSGPDCVAQRRELRIIAMGLAEIGVQIPKGMTAADLLGGAEVAPGRRLFITPPMPHGLPRQ